MHIYRTHQGESQRSRNKEAREFDINICAGPLLREVPRLVPEISEHWNKLCECTLSLLTDGLMSFVGCEMTGDTESYGRGAWAEAKNAKIMWVLNPRIIACLTMCSITTVR